MPREEVYIRGGQTLYKIDDWLQSGFCTLMNERGRVLKCRTRHGMVEDQLFNRSDLQSPPSYEQSGRDEKKR